MFEFLNRARGKGDKKTPDAGPSTTLQTIQFSAMQRDLARLTLQHLLRHHAIPASWVRSELEPIHIPGEGQALLLQLEVMHWNDALVLHALALQNELLQGLRRIDPASNGTRYLFSWKFHPDCGSPYTQLPAPDFWSNQSDATPATRPAAPAATHDDDDHGFAPTQIHHQGPL